MAYEQKPGRVAIDVFMYLNIYGSRVTGEDIARALKLSSAFQAYAILAGLRRRGLITVYRKVGNRHTYYVLTRDGKELAAEIARQWREAS